MRIAHPGSQYLSWAIAATLLGLLALLATLQYRWLEEVNAAQRQQTRSSVEQSARLFARDFDREITRILAYSHASVRPHDGHREGSDPASARLADFYRRWSEVAPYPEVVRDVSWVRYGRSGELELQRFDPASGELREEAWTDDLAPLARRLTELAAVRRPGPPEVPWNLLDGETPSVIMPQMMWPRPRMRRGRPLEGWPPDGLPPDGLPPDRAGRNRQERDRDGRSPDPGGRAPESLRETFRFSWQGYLVFRLDPDPLLEQLADRYFGDGGELQYHLRIVGPPDRERVVFEAGPEVAGNRAGPLTEDAGADLFGFLEIDEIRQLAAGAPLAEERRHEDSRHWMALNALSQLERPWRLAVTHPSGSLQAAVEAGHRRNLAISLGILLILGTAVVLLLLVTRRAQVLARQQIEFVAGVTHELRTPLAAMRSAGANLADGVVRDESQVRRYGSLIEREGRRLSDMVSQVLEYAGIQSGRRFDRRERTTVRGLVEAAVAESRPLLDEKGFDIEVDVPADLPDVVADAAALRRALGNLIGNAAKYAGAGAWIAVRARHADGEVTISVEDRGPGIAPEDLRRLFEPFYRGRDLSAGRVPGSGLGLSLVRHICAAHGGRVSVTSRLDAGSTFTLHLPAAAPAEEGTLEAEACEA